MIYKINHRTSYYYYSKVSLCHNLAHLAARHSPWQTTLRSDLRISIPPAVSVSRTDYFGNPETFFTIQEPHEELEVTAVNVVRTQAQRIPEPGATMPWETARQVLGSDREASILDAYQFAFDSHYVQRDPVLAAFATPSFPSGRPLLEAVVDLTRRIFLEFVFDPYATTIDTPPRILLETRRGVCQDFAHLEIGCLRSLGLAARYVSGYLLTNPPPGQSRLIGSDASHAWLSVFCPGFGWIDVDPTNDLVPANKHITLAWGRDYDDVSPIKGVILGGGRHSVSVAVDVVPSPDLDRNDRAEEPQSGAIAPRPVA